MVNPLCRQIALVLLLVFTVAGCGKKADAPEKSTEQAKSERDASAAKARESAVFGDQLKAMDKAKATADEAGKAAADRAKKADQ